MSRVNNISEDHAKQKIIEAIKAKNLHAIESIIEQYPFLAHTAINPDEQTALILAAESNSEPIVSYFLKKGANIYQIDKKGLAAIDYAAFQKNTALCQLLLNVQKLKEDTILSLIQDLSSKISTYLLKQFVEDNNHQHICKAILAKLLEYLAKSVEEQHFPEKIIDLYCVANSIFYLVLQSKEKTDLINKIITFFRLRENVLRGDAHDYCFNNILANQLCIWLAKYLFPDRSPFTILYHDTLTKKRNNPWQNPYTLAEELPDNSQEFFRNHQNEIQLYEAILERAISELKAGAIDIKKIWLSTDIKQISTEEKREDFALRLEDLNILRQRSPALQRLVNYTESLKSLSEREEKITLYAAFTGLQEGLRAGASHGFAEASSHLAIANFSNWWHRLSPHTQKKIRTIAGLGSFIEQTLHYHDYCTVAASMALYNLLGDQRIRDALNQIDGTLEYRMTNQELDEWKSVILKELTKNKSVIHVQRNIFQLLSQQCKFLHLLKMSDFIDFSLLSLLGKILSQNNLASYTINEKQTIVNEIFAINDTSVLLQLYNIYIQFTEHTKNNALFFAVIIKLYCLKWFTDNTVKQFLYSLYPEDASHILNELLYYAVSENYFEEAKRLLQLGANPITASKHYQHVHLDLGYQVDLKSRFRNAWSKATVIKRQGGQVLVHHDGSNAFWDEWVDFTTSQQRFAQHGTFSEGKNGCYLFPSTINYQLLWIAAFRNNNVELAVLLMAAKDPYAKYQHTVLLTATHAQEWKFINEYLTKANKQWFTEVFKQSLFNLAVEQNRFEVVEKLALMGITPTSEHLQVAFAVNSPALLTKILVLDNTLTNKTALLATAAEQNWRMVLTYLAVRKVDELTLQQLLVYAISGNQTQIVKDLLNHHKVKPIRSIVNVMDMGFKCDIKALNGQWLPATILQRDKQFFTVKYDKNAINNESIDFYLYPQRFALYQSYSANHFDQNYLMQNRDNFLLEIAYINKNAEVAVLLSVNHDLMQQCYKLFRTAITKADWRFVCDFLLKFKIEQLDEKVLQDLLTIAIDTQASEAVIFLIEYGVKFSSQHLQNAFVKELPSTIEYMLQKEEKLNNEPLLIAECDRKNWPCVIAYIKHRAPTPLTFKSLLANAIADNNITALKAFISAKADEFDVLLIAKRKDNWHCIFHLLHPETNGRIMRDSLFLDFNKKRNIEYAYTSYLIKKENNPFRIIYLLKELFELEKLQPLLTQRIGKSSSFKGYFWKDRTTSRAWIHLVNFAKERILEITQINKSFFKNDVEIIDFLNTKTTKWAATFYYSTSSFEKYKVMKDKHLPTLPLMRHSFRSYD